MSLDTDINTIANYAERRILGVTQIQPFGFDGRFLTPLRCVRNDALFRGERGGIGNRQLRRRFPIPLVFQSARHSECSEAK